MFVNSTASIYDTKKIKENFDTEIKELINYSYDYFPQIDPKDAIISISMPSIIYVNESVKIELSKNDMPISESKVYFYYQINDIEDKWNPLPNLITSSFQEFSQNKYNSATASIEWKPEENIIPITENSFNTKIRASIIDEITNKISNSDTSVLIDKIYIKNVKFPPIVSANQNFEEVITWNSNGIENVDINIYVSNQDINDSHNDIKNKYQKIDDVYYKFKYQNENILKQYSFENKFIPISKSINFNEINSYYKYNTPLIKNYINDDSFFWNVNLQFDIKNIKLEVADKKYNNFSNEIKINNPYIYFPTNEIVIGNNSDIFNKEIFFTNKFSIKTINLFLLNYAKKSLYESLDVIPTKDGNLFKIKELSKILYKFDQYMSKKTEIEEDILYCDEIIEKLINPLLDPNKFNFNNLYDNNLYNMIQKLRFEYERRKLLNLNNDNIFNIDLFNTGSSDFAYYPEIDEIKKYNKIYYISKDYDNYIKLYKYTIYDDTNIFEELYNFSEKHNTPYNIINDFYNNINQLFVSKNGNIYVSFIKYIRKYDSSMDIIQVKILCSKDGGKNFNEEFSSGDFRYLRNAPAPDFTFVESSYGKMIAICPYACYFKDPKKSNWSMLKFPGSNNSSPYYSSLTTLNNGFEENDPNFFPVYATINNRDDLFIMLHNDTEYSLFNGEELVSNTVIISLELKTGIWRVNYGYKGGVPNNDPLKNKYGRRLRILELENTYYLVVDIYYETNKIYYSMNGGRSFPNYVDKIFGKDIDKFYIYKKNVITKTTDKMIYVSEDQMNSWKEVEGLPETLPETFFISHDENTDSIYIDGGYGNEIHRSKDGGKTWKSLKNTLLINIPVSQYAVFGGSSLPNEFKPETTAFVCSYYPFKLKFNRAGFIRYASQKALESMKNSFTFKYMPNNSLPKLIIETENIYNEIDSKINRDYSNGIINQNIQNKYKQYYEKLWRLFYDIAPSGDTIGSNMMQFKKFNEKSMYLDYYYPNYSDENKQINLFIGSDGIKKSLVDIHKNINNILYEMNQGSISNSQLTGSFIGYNKDGQFQFIDNSDKLTEKILTGSSIGLQFSSSSLSFSNDFVQNIKNIYGNNIFNENIIINGYSVEINWEMNNDERVDIILQKFQKIEDCYDETLGENEILITEYKSNKYIWNTYNNNIKNEFLYYVIKIQKSDYPNIYIRSNMFRIINPVEESGIIK